MAGSLNLLNSEILAVVATVAGISRDPEEWAPADKSDMRQCIRRGMRKFYQPQPLPNSTIHQWRFLERKLYLVAEEPYSTGVLRVSGGTGLLVGGTIPSWASNGLISADGKILYVLAQSLSDITIDNTAVDSESIVFNGTTISATATSGSRTITMAGGSAHTVVDGDVGKVLQITAGTNFIAGQYTVESVNTTAQTWTLDAVVSSGSASAMVGATGFAYVLYRYRYPLPANFAEFIGAVTYSNGSTTCLLKNTDDKEIRLRYGNNFRIGQTNMYSIQHGSSSELEVDAETGLDAARWYISFWPTLDSEATVTSIYRISPLDNLDEDDITDPDSDFYNSVQVDPVHAETLMAAILSAVDEIYNDRIDGIYHTLFLTRLAASIAHDRHVQGNQDFWNHRHTNNRAFYLLNHLPTYDTV